ncbi:MAG: DNA helicase RecQ [Saprospiraceae bacterium]|nr:DNA helicase RecQ [Saprospiraceae bacterium]
MNISNAQAALKKYFGYDTFRPMQADIVQSIYDRRDCLVLMPTGGGKSICYQIPAVTTEGVTVVVSPLISLMKDQVEALKANGIAAAFMNSSQSYSESQVIENQLFENKIKLIYVSPEKAVSQSFLPILKNLNISLIAIDEAHCISAWGHDFRPEYAQLGFLKQQMPHIPIIALTATADKLTRKDIIEKLNLNDPSVFISSFDRPNLSLEVRPGQKRMEQILAFIKSRPQQVGIIYCLSRRSTEEVAVKLLSNNIKAAAYHAQMSPRERSKVQEDFQNDKVQVVCATVAFGMGIDKSNVRWVIHYNLPKNIESYYQEIGRSGRDGAPAETVLFYSFADVNAYREMFGQLESSNQEIQNAKLDRMLQYADAQICRRRILLNYFSENHTENCGNCDICNAPPQYIDGTILTQMALSAVARTQEQVNMSLLVDILRGSSKYEVIERGYDKIKTYGVGRNVPITEWQSYVWQIIQLGYLEIAYEDKHKLKMTPSAKEVLFNGQKVQLFKPLSIKERQEIEKKAKEQKAKTEAATPRLRIKNQLFDYLREFRRLLAIEKGMPPYIIFSDATLGEMAASVPRNEYEMRQISGIGEQKWQQYGQDFLDKIETFLSQNPDFIESGAVMQKVEPKQLEKTDLIEKAAEKVLQKPPKAPQESKVPTQTVTYNLFKTGLSIEEIAEQRFLSPTTIQSHLVQLYEAGEPIDVFQFVSLADIQEITEGVAFLPEPLKLKELHEFFSERFTYGQLKFALAYQEKNKTVA